MLYIPLLIFYLTWDHKKVPDKSGTFTMIIIY